MQLTKTSILLIEDNPAEAKLIEAALINNELFQLECISNLDDALIRLNKTAKESLGAIDVILLDLSLNIDCEIAFDKVFTMEPNALIIVLSAACNEEIAKKALLHGASDYFVKEHVDTFWLPRILQYVTKQKATEKILREAEDALFKEKERAQVTLNSIGDAVLATDLNGKITYLNLAAEKMTGWPLADAIEKPFEKIFNIIDAATRKRAKNPAQQAMDENRTVGLAANSVLISRDGHEHSIEDSAAPIHNRDGSAAGAVIVFHDVSESRTMALKMSHLAQHDFLTGLPNRLLLTERIFQAVGLAQRNRKKVGLLFLDLDHFKTINDSLGHAVGDQLLQSVAERLVSCVRTTDTVCRQGGDEFVILLTEIEHAEDASNTAEKLLISFLSPHFVGAHELYISLSVGISVFPDDGNSVEILLQNADYAMYHAKEIGRNNFQFFKVEMNVRAVQRLFIEASLRRALKDNEFLLYYQPKINLSSGAIIGSEALIRWQDPDRGLIHPLQFIKIAEECGLIVPIGRWVLREACRQTQEWISAGLRVVPVAINISAVELKHKNFLQGVAHILKSSQLPAKYLEMELTESILMHDAELSVTILEGLKLMGIQLAIDDFGTGYSSLTYLQRFPIDTLKIDQSFVANISDNQNNSTIISAVIGMGQNLNQRVIAEGVETLEQFTFLCNELCDEGQGFYFSPPVSAKDFSQLLEANPLCSES